MLIILLVSLLTVPILPMEHELFIDVDKWQVFDKIFTDIFTKTGVHDITVVLSNDPPTNHYIADDIIKIAMNNYIPINSVASLGDLPHQTLFRSSQIHSNTLLLFLYKSNDLLRLQALLKLCHEQFALHNKRLLKVLVVVIFGYGDAAFHKLLRNLWVKKQYMLDVSVVVMSRVNGSLAFTVHQYNPFSGEYTRQPYSPSVDWFPNKLLNLHGYPIEIRTFLSNQYSSLGNIATRHVMPSYQVYENRTLMTLKRMMNFSIIEYENKSKKVPYSYGILLHTLQLLRNSKFETIFTGLPITSLGEVPRSESFSLENWCPVMPVLYSKIYFEYDRIMGVVFMFVIIMIFWLTSIILRFESDAWRVLNIFGMIISYPLAKFKIAASAERVLFVSVFVVSLTYSSDFVADLTTITIGKQEEIPVETFRDLLRHNLTPVFPKEFKDYIRKYATGDFVQFLKTAQFSKDMRNCVKTVARHGNVACFVPSRMRVADISMYTSRRKIMVNEKLCYSAPPNVYYFKPRSPYPRRVTDILLRAQQAGLTGRWFLPFPAEISRHHKTDSRGKRDQNWEKDDNPDEMGAKIFIIVGCGYVISILALLAELVLHRLSRFAQNFRRRWILRFVFNILP